MTHPDAAPLGASLLPAPVQTTLRRVGEAAEWVWLPERCDPSRYPAQISAMEELGAHTADRREMEHDPRWLSAISDETKGCFAALLQEGEVLDGYALFWCHPSSLQYRIGEWTIASVPIRRYVLTSAVVMRDELSHDAALMSSFFALLRKVLPNDAVLYMQGVPVDSPLYGALTEKRGVKGLFRVVPNGPVYKRRMISLEGGFEGYLAKLGKATRKDVKRTIKQFREQVPDARVICFMRADEIDLFLRDAETVSKKTYQWNLLGEGVASSPWFQRLLRAAAMRSAFRSYIVYSGNRPVAFQLGYLFAGTYFGHFVGYDPEFAKLQPGIFLHAELIADLSAPDVGAKSFDFLYGDSLYKERLSTSYRSEQSFYLIPRTFRGSALAISLRATNGFSASFAGLLEKYGLKDRVKKLLRRGGRTS